MVIWLSIVLTSLDVIFVFCLKPKGVCFMQATSMYYVFRQKNNYFIFIYMYLYFLRMGSANVTIARTPR